MNQKYTYKLLIVFILIPFIFTAQKYLNGVVIDNEENPLINATVNWINTTIGTITDINGEFRISTSNITNKG